MVKRIVDVECWFFVVIISCANSHIHRTQHALRCLTCCDRDYLLSKSIECTNIESILENQTWCSWCCWHNVDLFWFPLIYDWLWVRIMYTWIFNLVHRLGSSTVAEKRRQRIERKKNDETRNIHSNEKIRNILYSLTQTEKFS